MRQQEDIPQETVAMAVALAGGKAPMKEGQRHAKRQHAVAKGKAPSGPAGYQEVGGATGSYYDCNGERRLTRRMARMPVPNNATLKGQLPAEGRGAFIHVPIYRVSK